MANLVILPNSGYPDEIIGTYVCDDEQNAWRDPAKPQWSKASPDTQHPKIYIQYGNGNGVPENWVIHWPFHYHYRKLANTPEDPAGPYVPANGQAGYPAVYWEPAPCESCNAGCDTCIACDGGCDPCIACDTAYDACNACDTAYDACGGCDVCDPPEGNLVILANTGYPQEIAGMYVSDDEQNDWRDASKPQWSKTVYDPTDPTHVKIYIQYGNENGVPENWVIHWPFHYHFRKRENTPLDPAGPYRPGDNVAAGHPVAYWCPAPCTSCDNGCDACLVCDSPADTCTACDNGCDACESQCQSCDGGCDACEAQCQGCDGCDECNACQGCDPCDPVCDP